MKTCWGLFWFLLCIGLPVSGFADDEPIIVTANRQAEPASKIAGSIFVLDQNRLQQVSSVHPAELLNEVSGVNIHRNSGQEHLTAIRSPVLTGGAGAGSFLYLQDGVPLRAAGFANVNGLFESAIELAQSVEVTKGPGSVLYGSNAVHGLVNIISKAPSPQRQVSLDLIGNENGFAKLLVSQSGRVLSGQARISASIVRDPGFRADSGFEQQKLQLRHDTDIGRWSVKTLASFQNLNQETAGFIRGVDAYKDRELSKTNPNPEAFRDGKSARFAVHLNKAIGQNSRLSLIPYARWVELSFLRHFVPGQALEDSGHKSVGLIATYEGAMKNGTWKLGLDSEYTNGYVREFQDGPDVFSFVSGAHYDYDVSALVLSPYVQTRFALGTKTNLSIGARADSTQYVYDNNIESGQFGRFLRIPDRKDRFFNVSPKLGITHDLNDNMTVYGRLARGSRAPQVSDAYSLQINQSAGQIRPETLDSAELGFKGNINGVRVELAGFLMKKNNFFFRNANGFNVENGKTRHQGIELDFEAPMNKFITVSGGFTLAEHSYAFTDIVASASNSIRDGEQVDSAPNTLGYLQTQWQATDKAELALKWQHVGSYYTDPGNTTRYPGHNIFTLRGRFDLSSRVQLYGRIDNIFDARYANRADFAFGSQRFFPGRPRTLFFGVRFVA
ncbi:TonB-dependent receptor [hydrothermal vent metagenome]|uniref:TonB-dependent receptor n=1 Tax=hydrothermal vent metagenome TaxID=652676 RepID=A0A3B0RI77_9ZZZZ